MSGRALNQPNKETTMNTLIEQILEAHGGLARWHSHDRLSAHLSPGGHLILRG